MEENENENEQNQNGLVKSTGNAIKDAGTKKAKDELKKKVAGEATKKVASTAAKKSMLAALAPVITIIAIVVLVVVITVGIVTFLVTMPGMAMTKLKEFAHDVGCAVASYFGADSTKMVSGEDINEVLDYMESMGYDLKGYGFLTSYTDEDWFGRAKDDEEDGVIRYTSSDGEDKEDKIKEAESEFVFMYLVSDNYTYTVKNFNLSTQQHNHLGFLESVFTMYTGYIARLGNLLINRLSLGIINNAAGEIWGNGMIAIYYESGGIGGKGGFYGNGLHNDPSNLLELKWPFEINHISVDADKKKLIIKKGALGNSIEYDLEGWTGRYGMPLEFLLAVHLGTMMPDLAYDMATSFPTEVEMLLHDVDGSEDTYQPYISKVTHHWYRDIYYVKKDDIDIVDYDVEYENIMKERWTLYETYDSGPMKGEYKLYAIDASGNYAKSTSNIRNYSKASSKIKEENGLYLFDGTQSEAEEFGIDVVKKAVIASLDEDEMKDLKWNKDSGRWTAYVEKNGKIEQEGEGLRTETNSDIKRMFLHNTYFRYDGTTTTAEVITKFRKEKEIELGALDFKYDELKNNTDCLKDIKTTYKDESGQEKEYTLADVSGQVNINQDSLNAFSMLENTHTLEADYIYRDFKELVVELGYFTKEELTDGAPRLLAWLVPDTGSYGYPSRAIDKSDFEFGTMIHSKGDIEANEQNTIKALLEKQDPEPNDGGFIDDGPSEGGMTSNSSSGEIKSGPSNDGGNKYDRFLAPPRESRKDVEPPDEVEPGKKGDSSTPNQENESTKEESNKEDESENKSEDKSEEKEDEKSEEERKEDNNTENQEPNYDTKVNSLGAISGTYIDESNNCVMDGNGNKYTGYLVMFEEDQYDAAKDTYPVYYFEDGKQVRKVDSQYYEHGENYDLYIDEAREKAAANGNSNNLGLSTGTTSNEVVGTASAGTESGTGSSGSSRPSYALTFEVKSSSSPDGGYDSDTVVNGVTYHNYKQGNYPNSSPYTVNTTGPISSHGCSVTSSAILLSGYGVDMTPVQVADTMGWSLGSNDRVASVALTQNGVPAQWFDCTGADAQAKVMEATNDGKPVIALMTSGGSISWTGGGHFVTILGVKSDGTPLVSDPGHRDPEHNDSCPEQLSEMCQYMKGVAIPDEPPKAQKEDEGDPYVGYLGNEAVVSPVTGILLEYGTYDNSEKYKEERTNVDLKYERSVIRFSDGAGETSDNSGDTTGAAKGLEVTDKVGYAKILVLDAENFYKLQESTNNDWSNNEDKSLVQLKGENKKYVDDKRVEQEDAVDDWSTINKTIYGYKEFAEEYEEGGIAGNVVFIDGFKCEDVDENLESRFDPEKRDDIAKEIPNNGTNDKAIDKDDFYLSEDEIDDEDSYRPNLYEPEDEYNALSIQQTNKINNEEKLKTESAPTLSINYKGKELLFIKEGTVLGRTLTDKELLEGSDYRNGKYGTYEEKREGEDADGNSTAEVIGNYLRIIFRDKDDVVIANVEDYMKLDDGTKKKEYENDWVLFYWLPFESGAADTKPYTNGRFTGPVSVSSCSSGEVAIGIIQETSLTSSGMCNQSSNFIPFMKEEYPEFYTFLSPLDGWTAGDYWSDYQAGASGVAQNCLKRADDSDHEGFLHAQMQEAKKYY